MRKNSTADAPAQPWPLVVGTVHSAQSLAAALDLKMRDGGPDVIELRVDHFAENLPDLDALTPEASRPFIVTARHPLEGGVNNLSARRRRDLYARFVPGAHFVDIEVRSLEVLNETVQAALASGKCALVASFHDFEGMPSLRRLHAQAGRAVDHGAHILKIAATVRTGADLAILLKFLSTERRLPLALMGMGPLGRVSRLALAAAGSLLNYGFLGETPQVSGQWPAARLRERIDELLPDRKPAGFECIMESLLARRPLPRWEDVCD